MANILDYLNWRGDLDFKKSPFNEVDTTILCMLSYLDLADIVPECGSGSDISIQDASLQYFRKFSAGDTQAKISPAVHFTFLSNLEELLKVLAVCPRFESVRLSDFKQDNDFILGRQFAAITFTIPEVHLQHVVAFRGTDKTFMGWKEDFELVYLEQTPAQDSAARYLEDVLTRLPGQFLVCGHSKGGNLAVYAGCQIDSPLQERILSIMNLDGPGFDFSIVERTPFVLIETKILNIVPEESMVGMLLEAVGKRKVICSSARYASQHNAFHWEIERTQFVPGTLGDAAKLLDRIIKNWLMELSLDERKAFLEVLFDLLGASEGTMVLVNPLHDLKEIRLFLKKYSHLDKETKWLLNQAFGSLSTQTKETISATLKFKLPGKERGSE